MAVKDTTKKPYIEDRDENVFIGIDLPFHRSSGRDGWFASTTTTIDAVKNNIRNLLNTHQGERLMQPSLGINLRKYLFQQVNDDVTYQIQTDIIEVFRVWLPFVNIVDIKTSMSEVKDAIGNHTLKISIDFNIKQDPNTLESVNIEIIGE